MIWFFRIVRNPAGSGLAWLLGQAGSRLRQRGRYPAAEPLLLRALAIREQVLGPEYPDTASCRANLASAAHSDREREV